MDLFVSVDSEGGDHDIPDTFFPAPKYFIRNAGENVKVAPRLQADADCEDERQDARKFQHVPNLKTAMGKELAESYEKSRRTTSMLQQSHDEWDLILDMTVDPI